MKRLALLLSVVSVSVYAELQEIPGTLVPPFGGMGTGFNIVDFGAAGTEDINSIVLDSQGRIVAGARGGIPTGALIARFTSDGILDTTFGGMGTGFIVIPMAASSGFLESVIIDAEGRIVGGGQDGAGASRVSAITRVTPNGILDTSFGEMEGFTTVDLFPFGDERLYSITFDSEERIVGVGAGNLGFVIRFTADGILDTTFGGTGTGSNIVSSIFNLKGVVVDDQGRIIAVGSNLGGLNDPLIVRFTPDGVLDTTFGGNGTGINVIDLAGGGFEEVKFDKEGRIVAVGSASTDGVIIARFNTDGTLDTTFGGSGLGYNLIPIPGGGDILNSFAFDLQGRIVAGGLSLGSNDAVLIMRFTYDGVLDPSFGGDGTGFNLIQITSSIDQINSLVIDAGGNIVGGGGETEGEGDAVIMKISNQSLTNLASSIRQKYLFSCT